MESGTAEGSVGGGTGEIPAAKAATAAGAAAVSIPESMVAPLIGAGANVYILTNEFTQSMREKLGTSWPFVQDTLNSRFAKLAAGGLLSSVAVIILWKIIKRLSQSKPKTPPPAMAQGDEPCPWSSAKTYEVTPVSERKPRVASRPDGEYVAQAPLHMLPRKIQLRIAETPLQANGSSDPDTLCKAKDPATRHRHTRRREQSGEVARGDPYTSGTGPWHSEHRGEEGEASQQSSEAECCSCPPELCGPVQAPTPQPRLLYSVRESRVVQRTMGMADPRLVNILTYSSCPSSLATPTLVTSPASPCVGMYPGSPQASPVGAYGASSYGPHVMGRQCPFHSAQSPHGLTMTPSLQHGSPHCALASQPCVHGGPGAVNSSLESRPTPVTDTGRGPGMERNVRGGEDVQNPVSCSEQDQGQVPNVPTRTAQSTVTPSHCNSAPHTTSTFPSHVAHSQATAYNTPQGGACQGGTLHSLPCQAGVPCANHAAQMTCHQHSAADHAFAQQQQQQQQQPVVQQPSDLSVSAVSSVMCSDSQDSRPCDRGGHAITGSCQSMPPPDVVPRDRLMQPDQMADRHVYALVPQPHRGFADHAQHEFPWRGPNSLHGYQPSPVYMLGVHPHQHTMHNHHLPHHPAHQPAWLTHGGVFMPHSPMASGPGGAYSHAHPGLYQASHPGLYPHTNTPMFASAPHGLYSPHGGMYSSAPHGPVFGGHYHNPFLYPHGAMPDTKPFAFNPNFNLSNSNPHVFVRQPGSPTVCSSSRIRWVESDHSIQTDAPGDVLGGSKAPVSSVGTLTTEDDLLESETVSNLSEHPESHLSFQAELAATEPETDRLRSPQVGPEKRESLHPSEPYEPEATRQDESEACAPDLAMTLPRNAPPPEYDEAGELVAEKDASRNNPVSPCAEEAPHTLDDLHSSIEDSVYGSSVVTSDGIETQL